jgi:sterol desaturase/sphingolipid hydroxylase (fatty acid hydroxylase superfamily)
MDDTLLGTRGARGEWSPTRRVGYSPVFVRPFRPGAVVRWLVGFPGYVLPYNALYLVVAVVAWLVATPSKQTTATFSLGWIGVVLVRNAVILLAWYGLAHVRLYTRRTQDSRFKYNGRWPAAKSDRFTLGSQLRENMFWTLASGLPIWTAWDVVTLRLFSSGRISWLNWASNRAWFMAWFLLIPLWREVHFYATHRLIHWPPLYKAIHSLHHRNTNPGPWSGLSMHPVEHIIYFSAIAIHWIVPSHPLHAMYTSFHLMMAPVPGHSGFERVEFGTRALDTGCYAHYLHHKYFEVNYSDGALPLDKIFGSFHDGSPEADEAMKRRRLARRTAEPAES